MSLTITCSQGLQAPWASPAGMSLAEREKGGGDKVAKLAGVFAAVKMAGANKPRKSHACVPPTFRVQGVPRSEEPPPL